MEVWLAGRIQKQCMYMCCQVKGKIGGIGYDEWRCHGKGGNMEKQRKNGSLQSTGYEIKSGSLRIA